MPARAPVRARAMTDTSPALRTAERAPVPRRGPRVRPLPRPLSLDEVRALYAGSTGELRLLVDSLYSTGARIAEMLAVTWDDIDWDERTVRLMGKGKVERIVPVAGPCMEALAEARGTVLPAYGVLFRFTSQNARDRLAALGKRLGLGRVHPHQFRHAYAVDMARNGATERVIQILLGHASPDTTQIYLTIADTEDRRRMIADAMSAIRGGVDMRRLRHTLTGLALR